MKGLLAKEWYSLKNSHAWIIIAVMAGMAFFLKLPFCLIYLPFLLCTLPSSTMIQDETSRWQNYMLGLSYSRKTIVSAKYVATLILYVLSLVLDAVLLLFISSSSDGSFNWTVYKANMQFVILSGLMPPVLMLPLNYKFGTAKARYISIVIYGLFFGCVSFLTSFTDDMADQNSTALFSAADSAVMFMILAVALILFMLSWLLSVRIFRKREF